VIEFHQQPAQKPLYYIDVPSVYDCEFAALSSGHALVPDIPAGAVVALKEADVSKILPGEFYLVLTDDFCGIRTMRSFVSDSGKVRLVPKNTTDYDEMIVDLSEIKVLYLVKGIIISKTL
jgi:SOS-response transcriptional repressor LexA